MAATFVLGIVGLPASAFVEYDGTEYNELVASSSLRLPHLDPPVNPGTITGSSSVDSRIWAIAFGRGYAMTSRADIGELVWQDGYQLQPLAAAAWEGLQGAARSAGISIEIVSAYRSISDQRALFLKKLYGTSTSAINARLAYSAPPGASRHHTGYTIDVKQGGGSHITFGSSEAFKWISANNHYNAKRFGFVPSYPPDGGNQGPNPEPWEYIYVGLETIAGSLTFADVSFAHFAFDSVEWMATNGHTVGCAPYLFCADDYATRSEVAVFLKRILESVLGPAPPKSFSDTTGHRFEDSIGWLAGQGITFGCDPPGFARFCPDRSITRGEISAMFKRAVGHIVTIDAEDLNLGHFQISRTRRSSTRLPGWGQPG